MNPRRRFLALVVCLSCLAVSPLAFAASAEEFVKAKQAELTTLLKQGAPNAKVDKVFEQVLDYSAIAQASLGDHWEGLKPEERKAFTELFSKVVRNIYRRNLKKTLAYDVEYKGAVKGAGGEVVRTLAKNKADAREEPLSIDYVVRTGDSGQRIVDIVTEGSSTIGNYRVSFNKIIKKSGFGEVMNRMRKKAEEGETATAVE